MNKPNAAPALDEVMLAMDVVDTLRHHEDVALRELAQDGRDSVLKERLRDLYESQGLEVSDRILDEGIKALKESRFTYEPTPAGLSRTLAGLWIRRGVIGASLAGLVLVVCLWIGWSVWQQASAERQAEAARIELTETLPAEIATAVKVALAEAKTDGARNRIEQLQADAQSALARSDAVAAKGALATLETVRTMLVQSYDLRIVTGANEQSGVYRVPDVNTGARNYYLIVEAVAADGSLLSFPILNEETNKTEIVSKWGVRVPEATYNSVRNDKMDDGIVQNNVLATKPRGALDPVYSMRVSGGAITNW
ncbi:DUF6384 family protein [uncultured Cohaesibacter sp.]|uniref:DUF6384 family protein n=1 Tax=uncultured Cohaesibacter sp. TaxID=1002546 RepID=UPI0029C68736|nr:DUF6384 family protein [uncultured Cohaesibacter sp.]